MPPEPSHPTRRIWLASLAAAPFMPAFGKIPPQVRRVGPGEQYRTLAAAVQSSAAGDHVELSAGIHMGQTAVVDRPLVLRGLGQGAVLAANGQHAMGKGTLVVKADVVVENIEFRGARVPDGIGAGIRMDSGNLRVRRCRFIDNEIGLLASNDPTVTVDIEDSVFADAPRHAGSLHHLLYAGAIASLSLTGCRFENGWRGHLVKSRARVNNISCNLLRDGPLGGSSYELELAHGGLNVVSGNIIVQGPLTQNPTLVAMGYDADPALKHSLVFSHNTLVNLGPARSTFLHLQMRRMPRLALRHLAHNLLVGLGRPGWAPESEGGPSAHVGLDEVSNAAADDYRVRGACRPSSLANGTAVPAWQPTRVITPPLGSRALSGRPIRCIGALFDDP